MLVVNSTQKLRDVEAGLRQAAQRHGAFVLVASHLGQLLREKGLRPEVDAFAFTVCQPELTAALLAADLRFATVLPCRIAACLKGDALTLEAVSPRDLCRLLDRPDLERLAAPLETVLREIMEEAAHAAPAGRAHAAARYGGVGATEGQVSARASIPQRIDCRGSKIEDLAGTGQHDSAGG